MPRITDARRELRRRQITEAALRCFIRTGMERTTIADITAESGLSAGSIYSHYGSKAEVVRAVAHELLQRRMRTLTELTAVPHPPSPDELIAALADTVTPDEARVGLQAWSEATTDPAIRAIVVEMGAGIRDLLRAGCETWLIAVEGLEPAAAHTRATAMSGQLMALYQASLLRSALGETFGPPPSTPTERRD